MGLNKIQNMLMGIAIGDAFGMHYEFRFDRNNIKENLNLSKYEPKYKEGKVTIEAAMYTDDTQMSIAVVELLLSEKTFNHENLAESFIKCYKRNPISGYSTRTTSALNESLTGRDYLSKVNSNSTRDGAAMRAVPFGIFNNVEDVVKYARINAEISHNTQKGIASSIAIGLMSHHHFNNVTDKSLFQYIEPYIKPISNELVEYFDNVDKKNTDDHSVLFKSQNPSKEDLMDGVYVAGAVMYILNNFQKPMDVLKNSVLISGDTDSIASMALGINMINHDINELSDFLFNNLTNHKYGRDYILDLGNELYNKMV